MTDDERVGGVAEEAAKLFASINGHDDHPEDKSGPECQWCPVCQLISLARHARPETVEQLASAATGVLSSLRGLIDAAAESARAAAQAKAEQDADKAADKAAEQAAESKSERIEVREDPEPWD